MSENPVVEPGRLYIVATPIGNLGDITLRALEVLQAVDVLFAEDTRVSRKICERYSISTPLRSYREAGTPQQTQRMMGEIMANLAEGKAVAYVSDAGTPGLSDPGSYLVREVREAGYLVHPIPGATTFGALLSAAGSPVQHPLFVGFLPKKKGRQTLLRQLHQLVAPGGAVDGIVLFESPERIRKLLGELLEWEGDYRVCLGRELTKRHEEIIHAPLPDVAEQLNARASIKGEIALLIYPD